jgi:hypothetical protein
MYVAVQHQIKDSQELFARGQKLIEGEGAPPGMRVREFYPGKDQAFASCLWEGDSVQAVQEYVDTTLGDASEQTYFEVDSGQSLGLPETAAAGS